MPYYGHNNNNNNNNDAIVVAVQCTMKDIEDFEVLVSEISAFLNGFLKWNLISGVHIVFYKNICKIQQHHLFSETMSMLL